MPNGLFGFNLEEYKRIHADSLQINIGVGSFLTKLSSFFHTVTF